jgi:hypothetical protein
MANLNKLLTQLKAHLDEDEKVTHAVLGAYEAKVMGSDSVRNGILAATEHRLVFYAKKMTGYELEVFPYSTISSIEMGKNITGYYMRFFASGNKVSIKWIRDPELAEFVSFVKNRLGHKASAPTASHDPMEQLKKLAELKDAGIITAAEFDAKKKKLLDI